MSTSIIDEQIEPVSESSSDGPEDWESLLSDTTSLASTDLKYEYSNGRRYHSANIEKYVLPNDEVEQNRLDLGHHCWHRLLKGRLFLAPLEERMDRIKNVLDLGTGTGAWVVDFADIFPNVEVLGTDLSPIQPVLLPPNSSFLIDDAEEPWTFDKKFDFIHGRNLVGAIQDWKALFKQAYDNLTPGGYIEFQESDITGVFSEDDTFKGTAFERYQNIVKTASLKINRRLDIAPELASLVREAGFVDVVETKIRWPFGVWPKRKDYKELGIMGKVILESGLEAYGLALMTRVLGMEAGEVKALCEEVKGNLKDRGVHCQEWQYVVVGRKPE